MPISERSADRGGEYEQRLDALLGRAVTQNGRAAVVQAFHAVRRMAYFSGADRTPLAALAAGRGACTAKHVILRDLLRRLGENAVVEIVEGDFASGIPVVASMPTELRERIERGGVIDFHCRTVWAVDGDERLLDATWPDELSRFGFPVNADWDGSSDTRAAIEHVTPRSRAEDVLTRKQSLLETLSNDAAEDRVRFLRLLSLWLGSVA